MTGDSRQTEAPAARPAGRSIGQHPLRKAFGFVLLVAWGLATFVWLASTFYLVTHGDPVAGVGAVAAVALLGLLGCMEGLEVSVIDRWQKAFPGRSTAALAQWLSARQLFVALIVTAATLLANRSAIVVPGTALHVTDGFALSVFDLVWTTLTVLWFAQILPKHLGATNPDRYLDGLKGPLFPVVSVVHRIGISQPGEWTAGVVEGWSQWLPGAGEIERHRHAHEFSMGSIWRELRKPVEPVEHRHEAAPSVGRGPEEP
jgi:hypothetical protein